MPSVHKIHKRKLYITCSLTCCCLLEFFIYSADSTYKERPVLIPQNKLSCYLEQKEESIVELDPFFKKSSAPKQCQVLPSLVGVFIPRPQVTQKAKHS